jgi:RHS repeat-associated protein
VHNAADELTQDANYNYSYDAEGNLVQKASKTDSSDVTHYTYDALDRLVAVTSLLGTSSYAYDGLGRRIARTVNGATTRYVFDGPNVRLELDAGNALTAANTHSGLDRLLVRDQGGAQLFFQRDALGSTIALTDASGNVVERYRYSAFGKLEVLNPDFRAKINNSPIQSYTYTGREWEPVAGLFFNRARFYDAEAGRFISRDPIGEDGGINLYAYTRNSPTNRTDRLGLWYALIPGSWFDGNGYEGSGANFYRGSDFDQGAYAGLDGLNPFGDPFANHGFYNPCDRTLQRSRAIGHVGLQLEENLLAGYAWGLFGRMVATEAGLAWNSLSWGEQWALSRGALHTFFWNSGLGGQAVAVGLTGAGGYGLYRDATGFYNDAVTIFGP